MIRVFDNPEAASRAAADLFVRQAREAVDDRGQFQVALAGGQTPRRTYQLLVTESRLEKIPWPEMEVFWGDERCVAPEDERSNAQMAREVMLTRVPVNADRVHPICCASDPKAEASRYEALLRVRLPATSSAFDLVFLGLGQDGHTASLFPGSSVLKKSKRWVAEVHPAGQDITRITLTPIILNAARLVVFLVFGHSKAKILKTILEGPVDGRRLPAQYIRPVTGRLVWLVDREAASLLERSILVHEKS